MVRKLLLTLSMLFMLPALGHAWTVNAKTSPATGFGTINPSGNQTYATGAASGEYVATAAPGYTLSRVTLDGVPLAANANGSYTVPYSGVTFRYVVAYFAAGTVNITTQISGGSGAIREDTYESLTGIPLGSSRQLLVIPSPGYRVASVTAGNAVVTDNADGSKTAVFSNLQSNQSVAASFELVAVVTVSAGANVSVNGTGAEYAGTLNGSATSNQGAITYAWSGTGLSFGTPDAAVTTVYAAAPGTYTATLTASSGAVVQRSSTQVTVVDRTVYLETLCSGCHSGNTPLVVAQYDASGHKSHQVSCQDCHVSPPHDAKASCVACHSPGNARGLPWPPTGLTFHNAYTATDQCYGCHTLHNPRVIVLSGVSSYPHFSTFTTAQYVTARISCDNCHTDTEGAFSIYPENQQWAKSGKANPASASWVAYDFKTRGSAAPATPANSAGDDCVRCHTSTGYSNFVSSGYTDIHAWGVSGLQPEGDRTREMLACSTCHITPFNAYFDTRGIQLDPYDPEYVSSWGPAVPSGFYNYSSAQTGKLLIKRDPPQSEVKSNICIACHIGKAAGSTIKAVALSAAGGQGTGPLWRNITFIDPHNMGAAGTIYRLTGYTYRAASAYTNPERYSHSGMGSDDRGNCVDCHMSAPDSHSFSPVTKDASGVITAITSERCQDCHAGGLHPIPDAAALDAFRQGYDASLQAVAGLLAGKNIYFNARTSPYFFTTADPALQSFATRTVNWDSAAPLYKGSDLMGAAFNLRLLRADAGSWAHNSIYTKRLLYDTVDFLDNGKQDNTVFSTLQNMPMPSPAVRDKALAYIGARP